MRWWLATSFAFFIMSRLLAICPRIRTRNGALVASTSLRMQVLSLGSYCRTIRFDPRTQFIRFSTRILWFIVRRKSIPFDRVEAVEYGYTDMAIGQILQPAHDSADLFTVRLRMKNGKEVHLFNFFGEGSFSNDGPFPDWFYWEEYALDVQGSQEGESKRFAELVAEMIGVEVVPPAP